MSDWCMPPGTWLLAIHLLAPFRDDQAPIRAEHIQWGIAAGIRQNINDLHGWPH